MLRIAIQAKGRLNEDTTALLLDAGIDVVPAKRKLVARAKGFPIDVLYLRDDDIPQAVAMGVAHCGIVGQNEIAERGHAVHEVMPLGFGNCRISLAVPRDAEYGGIDWFRGRRVATSYPRILRRYFEEQGINAHIHEIAGSVEIAPAVGMADAIFDIVSSGGTLVQNGLVEVESVFRSEAAFIATPTLFDPAAETLPDTANLLRDIETLSFRFRTIVESRNVKYVLMNLPRTALPSACRLIPGMRSPTVLPLATPDWCSLHVVIPESQLWEKVEQLKALGAEGILVLDVENMIK